MLIKRSWAPVSVLLLILLQSCSFFPGYIQSWANNVVGLGGTGWQDLGFVNTDVAGSGTDGGLDMVVSPQGEIMLSYIRNDVITLCTWLRSPGGAWTRLPDNTWADAVESFSIGFDDIGSEYLPVMAATFLDTGGTTVQIYSYNRTGGSWNNTLARYGSWYRQVQLVETPSRLDIVTVSNDSELIEYFSPYDSAAALGTISGTGYAGIRCSYNWDNTGYHQRGIYMSYLSSISIFSNEMTTWGMSGDISRNNIFSYLSGVLTGPGNGNNTNYILSYDTAQQECVIDRNVYWDTGYNNIQQMFNFSQHSFPRASDMVFDYTRRYLYVAIADQQGVITVYALWDTISGMQALTLGDPIQNRDAVETDLYVRNDRLYLALRRGDGGIEVWVSSVP